MADGALQPRSLLSAESTANSTTLLKAQLYSLNTRLKQTLQTSSTMWSRKEREEVEKVRHRLYVPDKVLLVLLLFNNKIHLWNNLCIQFIKTWMGILSSVQFFMMTRTRAVFDLLSVFKGGRYHATFCTLIMSLNPHWFGTIFISPLQIPPWKRDLWAQWHK